VPATGVMLPVVAVARARRCFHRRGRWTHGRWKASLSLSVIGLILIGGVLAATTRLADCEEGRPDTHRLKWRDLVGASPPLKTAPYLTTSFRIWMSG
jgi:hypothetical protein